MVVSAILLTALAPITGALFGASYGTSIRIGYEIIFPALFGDMINDQKNKISTSQEEGAKRTIKALHTMFTATGGASAMEFGIEQGIELAKKKTESPDVQHMIDLNLGLTDSQINKRGRIGRSDRENIPIEPKTDTSDVDKFKASTDFIGMNQSEIQNFFKTISLNEMSNALNLLIAEFGSNHIIVLQVKKIIKDRNAATDTPADAIAKTTTEGSVVQQIATAYTLIGFHLAKWRKFKINRHKTNFLNAMKAYNRLVTLNRKPQLQVDTAKSLASQNIIPKS